MVKKLINAHRFVKRVQVLFHDFVKGIINLITAVVFFPLVKHSENEPASDHHRK